MASPLLSEVAFGSYLVYSPRGESEESVTSRRVRDYFKNGNEEIIRRAVGHLAQNLRGSGLDSYLGPEVTLVPCPRSAVLLSGALWPSRLIATELVRAGLGRTVLPCLERVEAVPKSAFQERGNRPNAQMHFKTMRATPDLTAGDFITIVDDFITKGNTLLAGANRLREAYPSAKIRAFAFIRTVGFRPNVEHIIEPSEGKIFEQFPGEADRKP